MKIKKSVEITIDADGKYCGEDCYDMANGWGGYCSLYRIVLDKKIIKDWTKYKRCPACLKQFGVTNEEGYLYKGKKVKVTGTIPKCEKV